MLWRNIVLVGFQVTSLDLGGSNWNHQVWAGHICEVLRGMRHLQCLTLAHCHIPEGQLVLLLPRLTTLTELNIDRCACSDDEVRWGWAGGG